MEIGEGKARGHGQKKNKKSKVQSAKVIQKS